MRVVEDATEVARAGSWVIAATHGSTQVRALVPDVFASYARVFHPAMREVDERDLPLRAPGESRTGVPVYAREGGVLWREVSWREVAEANGKVAHPAMQWTSITGSNDFAWGGMQPGLWEPRLRLVDRPMIVACGPLSAVPEKSFSDPGAVECYRSPSLWWPDDCAWCVATDVDMQETFVGASADCVDCLIGDGRLEAMRATAEQSVAFDADTINPTPEDDR